jgi:hypothetical protein
MRGHWRHGLLVGLAAAAAQGCPERFEGDCSCDLECPAEGLAEGNASISGWASFDAYFRAALELGPVAAQASSGIDAELRAIAAGLDVAADAPAETIAAALASRIAASVDGELQVRQARAACETLTKTVAAAAAQCDEGIDPETAIVLCRGECTVEAATMCPQVSLARCFGTSPQCDGTCTGDCELAAASACAGTCRGDCSGTCSVRDALGRCAGRCEGMCLGTCELAGAACAGACIGTCESEALAGTCAADQRLRCRTQVDAAAACDGKCDGEVFMPMAEPACEEAVRAQAAMRAQCRPPAIDIGWQWSPALAGDAAGQAAFKAWLADHERHHAALLARATEGARILQTAAELKSAGATLDASIDGLLSGDFSLAATIGLGCARDELSQVAAVVDGGTAALQAAVSRAKVVTAALGGET